MSRLTPDPELERLVAELNRSDRAEVPDRSPGTVHPPQPDAAPPTDAPPLSPARLVEVAAGEPLEELLSEAVRHRATDLLLVPGSAPALRLDGRIELADRPPLDGPTIWSCFLPHLSAHAREGLARRGAADFILRLSGRGEGAYRFRVNLHRQRGTVAAALRLLPQRVPSLEELHLPPSLARLTAATRGLVLICGPTGSGKSTTVAALLDRMTRERALHLLTIEDPIEYELANHSSVVEQIEIGSDAPSFPAALRAALRQDPDVLFVGEMRDLETVGTAITAAETGHLVFATLHTNDVVQTVHRIVDVFPAGQQEQIRQQLALSLSAIVHQQLVPRRDRPGRVPAVEMILATYAVRNHVRGDKLHRLYNEIVLGKSQGMLSMEAALARWVKEGVVDPEEARIRAGHPDELDSLLRG